MGIVSELEFDHDRCNYCGYHLNGNVANIISRETLGEYDNDLYIMLMKEVECRRCGGVTKLHYMGEPVSTGVTTQDFERR